MKSMDFRRKLQKIYLTITIKTPKTCIRNEFVRNFAIIKEKHGNRKIIKI